ncbi:hypothetical protein K3495_g10764 [Podosphaera aphanis]|nr:hypothetical protein K3495_g10764 [Podosphaera aphanis]
MTTPIVTSEGSEMKIDPQRADTLIAALTRVSSRIAAKAEGRHVQLVAVSKLKPPSDILALYQAGHRNFGENYAQELTEKAALLPKDIRWHFIGGLQSNKCKPLASSLQNLYLVSSVDSVKKATQLNTGRAMFPTAPPLNIHIQVNTSGESSKSGTSIGSDTTGLALHILKSCPNLHLRGLMTIGAIGRSKAIAVGEENENEDFRVLKGERDRLEEVLSCESAGQETALRWGVSQTQNPQGSGEPQGTTNEKRKLELSMGMSDDFEIAIEMGSDEVRVGSTIFGQRPPKEEFSVQA